MLEGILIAVVLSILLFFQRSWWPHGEVLGRVDGRDGLAQRPATAPSSRSAPTSLVFRWEAPLFFANAGMFRQQVRHLVRERQPTWVVLQCEAITDIDVTAADMLERLDIELNAQGVHLAFVELRSRLQDLVYDYGLFADARPRPLLRLDRRGPRRHRTPAGRRPRHLNAPPPHNPLAPTPLAMSERTAYGTPRSSRPTHNPQR